MSSDPLSRGLPQNSDAERLVLGSILQDDRRYAEAAAILTYDQFSIERRQQVFRVFGILHDRGEHIDFVTVAEELDRRGELGPDGCSYLASLTDGMPLFPHIDSYARIVVDKWARRQVIAIAQMCASEAGLETLSTRDLLDNATARLNTVSQQAAGKDVVQSVDALESIFSDDQPVTWIIEPELPAGALVTLAGESESGKTTLETAWARDAHAKGHSILFLLKDGDPRERIRDRMRRLGINTDGPRFRVWDCQQPSEPPPPNSPIVTTWVKEQREETGLSPIVFVDSLISYLPPGASENDNAAMRAVFNMCRAVTIAGGTVVLAHHAGKSDTSKDGRGASDYRPAGDQGFTVSNHNPNGSRLLHTITLKQTKSRWALVESIVYHYDNGNMRRAQDPNALTRSVCDRLTSLLRTHPGQTKEDFGKIAVKSGVRQKEAREFLEFGLQCGEIRFEHSKRGPGGHYFLAETSGEGEDQ